MTERIALIGARGTGKTTVGRLLAAELGWKFIDADRFIESAHLGGGTIADLFRDGGEEAFRELEESSLQWLAGGLIDRLVLATGGGAVLRPINRERLKTCGLVAWLTAQPAVLWERMSADPTTAARRPNLTAAGGLAEVEAVLAAREPLYRETATHTCDTAGRSPADVAAAILREWTGRR
jgi:shikimate kinase